MYVEAPVVTNASAYRDYWPMQMQIHTVQRLDST